MSKHSPAGRLKAKTELKHQVNVICDLLPTFCSGHNFQALKVNDLVIDDANQTGVLIIDTNAEPRMLKLLTLSLNAAAKTPAIRVLLTNTTSGEENV